MNGTFTYITEESNEKTYRPLDADFDKYLRVTVEYVDGAGTDSRTLHKVTDYPVRRDTETSADPPKFPDQRTLIGGTSPTFITPTNGRTTTDRFIRETAAAGDIVGAPVTAFDDDTTIDELIYSLWDPATADGGATGNLPDTNDDGNENTPMAQDGHLRFFDIDPVTGQITVGARARLDRDATGATSPYIVVVRAIDGDGHQEDITVNIHVVEVGEPPTINRVYQGEIINSPFATLAVDARAPTEMSHYEKDNTSRPPRMIDADLDTSVLVYNLNDLTLPPTLTLNRLQPATYTATDEDAGETASLMWSLEGHDATKFVFVITNNSTTGVVTASATKRTGDSVTLAFENPPDFEKPADANTDNVYEVTIVVKDGTVDKMGMPHRDALKVTVKVINSEEDNQARKGEALKPAARGKNR